MSVSSYNYLVSNPLSGFKSAAHAYLAVDFVYQIASAIPIASFYFEKQAYFNPYFEDEPITLNELRKRKCFVGGYGYAYHNSTFSTQSIDNEVRKWREIPIEKYGSKNCLDLHEHLEVVQGKCSWSPLDAIMLGFQAASLWSIRAKTVSFAIKASVSLSSKVIAPATAMIFSYFLWNRATDEHKKNLNNNLKTSLEYYELAKTIRDLSQEKNFSSDQETINHFFEPKNLSLEQVQPIAFQNLQKLRQYIHFLNHKKLNTKAKTIFWLESPKSLFEPVLRKKLNSLKNLRNRGINVLYANIIDPVGICDAIRSLSQKILPNYIILEAHGSYSSISIREKIISAFRLSNFLPDDCFAPLSAIKNKVHFILNSCHSGSPFPFPVFDKKVRDLTLLNTQEIFTEKLRLSQINAFTYGMEGRGSISLNNFDLKDLKKHNLSLPLDFRYGVEVGQDWFQISPMVESTDDESCIARMLNGETLSLTDVSDPFCEMKVVSTAVGGDLLRHLKLDVAKLINTFHKRSKGTLEDDKKFSERACIKFFAEHHPDKIYQEGLTNKQFLSLNSICKNFLLQEQAKAGKYKYKFGNQTYLENEQHFLSTFGV